MNLESKLIMSWTVKTSDEIHPQLNQVICNGENQKFENHPYDTVPLTQYIHNSILIPIQSTLLMDFAFEGKILWVALSHEVAITVHQTNHEQTALTTSLLLLKGSGYTGIEFTSTRTIPVTGKILVMGIEAVNQQSSSGI